MPDAAAAVIDAAIALVDELLGVRADEAGQQYYYDEVILKRVLAGASSSGTCDICEENIEAGWIDSDDLYPDGTDGPPAHPNCVCEEEQKISRKRVYV